MHALKPSWLCTNSHFSLPPAIPSTGHPLILAICPTTEPTAPAAAATTVSPGLGRAMFSRPVQAVIPSIPSAPSAQVMGGIPGPSFMTVDSFATAYYCQPEYAEAISPGLKLG